MGVHSRERELKELQDNYIKKSSCILLVVMALLVGSFIGNTITILYLGQGASPQPSQSAQAPSGEVAPHEANPEALAKLEADAAANPTDAEGWIKLGNFCFDHNLPGKAAKAYERALELKPMNVGVWSDLGVMYRRTKQYDKALDAFRQAVALDKNHIVARYNMGVVYLYDLNDRANALKVWKDVLVMDPNAKAPNGKPVADLIRELEQ